MGNLILQNVSRLKKQARRGRCDVEKCLTDAVILLDSIGSSFSVAGPIYTYIP